MAKKVGEKAWRLVHDVTSRPDGSSTFSVLTQKGGDGQ